MSLWNRGIERSEEVKRSEALCKKRGELAKQWPAINESWNREDSGAVREAASELSIVLLMENPERILTARETLKQALWKRDGIRGNLDHQINEVNGEIESLNSPVIFEKAKEWQHDLCSLRDKKVISKIKTRQTVDAGVMVIYKSNFATIAATKEKLAGAISQLREMKQAPLSEVLSFIKKMEDEFLRIDFSDLKEEEECGERKFEELCSGPEVKVYITGRFFTNAKGQTKISKDYNLPIRELSV